MDDFFFNFERVKQATALAPQLYAAKLDAYDYAVLIFLASKMAYETDPENPLSVINTCYWSKEEIAKGAVCRVRRVGTAVANLKRCGFIDITKWVTRGKVEHNRYHLMPEVWDNAFTPKPKAKPATGEITPPAPVISAADRAADQAVAAEISNGPGKKDPEPIVEEDKYAEDDDVATFLYGQFPEHPTSTHTDGYKMLTTCARRCIDILGPNYSCLSAFQWIFDDAGVCAAAAKSDRLGGYTEGVFKNQFPKFKAKEDKKTQDMLDEICKLDAAEITCTSRRSFIRNVKRLGHWLREHLGAHLLEFVELDHPDPGEDVDEEAIPSFRIRLSDEYKSTRRLAVGSDKEEITAPAPSVTADLIMDDDDEDVDLSLDQEEEDRVTARYEEQIDRAVA
jgi:hypothetical protein